MIECCRCGTSQLTQKRVNSVPSEWWWLEGPVPTNDTNDADIELEPLLDCQTDAFGWGRVGRVSVSMELLPEELADIRPAGKGRDEPNLHPVLPAPQREVISLLSPISTLRTIFGDEAFGKLSSVLCCFFCVFLCSISLPMLISNLAADVLANAIG